MNNNHQSFYQQLAQFTQTDAHAAMNYVMQYACEHLNAKQAYWLCAVRLSDQDNDLLQGWRPIKIHYLYADKTRQAQFIKHCELVERGEIDSSIVNNVQNHGRFRVNITSQMQSEQWFNSAFYNEFYLPMGISDLLCSATPIADDIECWLCFERKDPATPYFSATEQAWLATVVSPLAWLHQRMTLFEGVKLLQKPLTPAEKNILPLLLNGDSEQAIAAQTGLKITTVHTYATRIYRKYDVKGRVGLMALWLGD